MSYLEYYNMSNLSGNATLGNVVRFATTSTTGLFPLGLVFAVWSITFLVLKSSFDAARCVAVASFVGFLVSAIFLLMGLIAWQIVALMLTMTVFALAFNR